VEVVMQGNRWVCRRCKAATHMMAVECSGCRFPNQSVALLKEAFGLTR
jgi:ribosomal protein L37E